MGVCGLWSEKLSLGKNRKKEENEEAEEGVTREKQKAKISIYLLEDDLCRYRRRTPLLMQISQLTKQE